MVVDFVTDWIDMRMNVANTKVSQLIEKIKQGSKLFRGGTYSGNSARNRLLTRYSPRYGPGFAGCSSHVDRVGDSLDHGKDAQNGEQRFQHRRISHTVRS